jgi:ribonuclease-3
MAEHPVESILHYQFSDHNLLDEALLSAGASVSSKYIEGPSCGNKRLALLGDSVLREAILEPWYRSNETTGKHMGQKLVGETNLVRGGFKQSEEPR